jgi:hypothetical protein
LFLFFCCALISPALTAQTPAMQPESRLRWFPKDVPGSHFQRFFFQWGYNRASFAKSNLHFRGSNYDFSLYDVVAHDRQTKFNVKDYLFISRFSIPQNNYRLGYFINRRWAISIGGDHMKYVMDKDQVVKISGVVTESASGTYAGNYLNEDIKLVPQVLTYEHTNGLNYATIDLDYHLPVFKLDKSTLRLNAYFGAGGVWVVTRTDVKVFGYGSNNAFHLAGYGVSGKGGFRLYFLKRVFLMGETKLGYMSLQDVPIHEGAADRANQTILFWEKIGSIGFDFNLWK